MFVLTAEEMRNADKFTIEELKTPGIILMENAGIGVVRSINESFPPEFIRRILVFCGKGNNGGDGFVVARHLYLQGDCVEIVLLGKREMLKGDAKTNMEIADSHKIPLYEVESDVDWKQIKNKINDADIIIDAILGTGITKPIDGLYKTVVEDINQSEAFIAAIDIPTGLLTDTGELAGEAIIADLTVTFAYPKLVHILPPAEFYCGDVAVVDICIPEEAVTFDNGQREIITEDSLVNIIKPRKASSHKGNYGHLLIVGGSLGKIGAASMAALSGTLSGAGLVSVASPTTCSQIMQGKLTQEMAIPLRDDGDGKFKADSIDEILNTSSGKTSIAIGPGLGYDSETKKLVAELIRKLEVPIILDADGLNSIQDNPEILLEAKNDIIITPHPGEFARLTGKETAIIQKDRIRYASEFAKKYKTIVVLKGYRTIIADPSGDIYIAMTGNPGMATGGTGDILTGIISGLIASGVSSIDACRLGVHVHGLAGDLAEEKTGETSLNAGEIINHLPEAFKIITNIE